MSKSITNIKFENILAFLTFECDWSRKKKDAMVAQATTFLIWNAAIFAFIVANIDVKKVSLSFINVLILNNAVKLELSLVILTIIGILFLLFSSLVYFLLIRVKKMENIEIDEYKNGFSDLKIIADYKKILKDYDETIRIYGIWLKVANWFMCIDVLLLIILLAISKVI